MLEEIPDDIFGKTVNSRFLTLLDLDELFSQTSDAIIINQDLDYTAGDYVEKRNAAVYARAGQLSPIARCNCYNLNDNKYIGVRCTVCGTLCRDDFSKNKRIEHSTWLGMPPDVKGVLHPVAYLVLTRWLAKKNTHNWIDVIIDPSLELPVELKDVVFDRGQNYFYDNFDKLIEFFLNYARTVDKKSAKGRNADAIEQFVRNYRSVLFCTKLPVMSSVLSPITSADGSTDGRQYADAESQVILDAATDLASLSHGKNRRRPGTIQAIIHRIYKSYVGYIQVIMQDRLSKKPALLRRHMLGSRLHFSLRAVIIPHAYRYDELYFPWGVAVNLLKLHIVGKLVTKYKMDINAALLKHVSSITVYDPQIDQIMKELIEDVKPEFPGLPILFNRNPKLHCLVKK